MKLLSIAILLSIYLFGINHYHVIHQSIVVNNQPFRAIRSFEINQTTHYLVVNETTLETQIIAQPTQAVKHHRITPYQTVLEKYSQPPYTLQNYGVTSMESDKIYITTDLCPSSQKGYERAFYQNLIKNYPNPVEITLFISGNWIDKHLNAFNELKQWEKEKKLKITWGNHTYTHPYYKKLPLKENFLLAKGVDIAKEILDLEKKLIGHGVTPSIFFRFPGLVQNEKAVKTLKKLGVIAVGSNEWLAKCEKVQKGSIILLHGNKHEPE